MIFLYNIFIIVYALLLRLAAIYSPKAKAWTAGRVGYFEKLNLLLKGNTAPLIWVHCASSGEAEQARPLMEALKKNYPVHKIFITFFSPSGYQAAARWATEDYYHYLPLDTAANARKLMQRLQPKLVIFSKYDFWFHHIKAASDAGIPVLLISAVFRPHQVFFIWYGAFYKKILQRFTHLFVQDKASLQLLNKHGIHHCSISGDTRFDRVLTIAQQEENFELQAIKLFTGGSPCIVAGSTWPGDEALMAQAQKKIRGVKWIIVPHEIDTSHLEALSQQFPDAVRLSEIDPKHVIDWAATKGLWTEQSIAILDSPAYQQLLASNVLIVDAMGLLSKLYQLATVAYVGGGFTKDGIHNVLEAAVWHKPVVIGPNYKKYREAHQLINKGGAFSVKDAMGLQALMQTLLDDAAACEKAAAAAGKYVQENGGATARIMGYIQEKRLLTN